MRVSDIKSRSGKARMLTSYILAALLLLTSVFLLASRSISSGKWYIDTEECIGCGDCATECIKSQSAVRAVIDTVACSGLDKCRAFYRSTSSRFGQSVANQNCPTGAFKREKDSDRYFYWIDESLCIGCGKCFRGCRKCEGAIKLEVKDEFCVNCNDCKIELSCPTNAFKFGKPESQKENK